MDLRFDRGTFLLHATEAEISALQGPDIVWDERVAAWRVPAFRHADLVARASERGVQISDRVRIPDGRCAITPPPLRPYQEDALAAWDLCGRRGCVSLPTGSGKTVIALAAIARCGAASLVLVPTRVLLEQWRRALAAHSADAVGVYGDGSREVMPLTVCTFESAYRNLDDFGDRFRLLVVDEVHHFASGVRSEALEMTVAPWRLGLSATLPESREGTARLSTLVGPTVFEMRVGDLAGSFLAPLDRVLFPVELTPPERAEYAAAYEPFTRAARLFRATRPGSSWAELVRALARTDSGRAALDGWRRARALLALARNKRATLAHLLREHADRRTLIFTADNASAYAISREFLIPALTCEIGRTERTLVLDRFRRGELRALVSSRVLNEGLDVPDAEVGIVLGGALGSGEHAQRAGRILRPSPGKRATLYEIVVRDTMEWNQCRRRQKRLAPHAALAR
jgi:superfamily II DNA or RNA helicase